MIDEPILPSGQKVKRKNVAEVTKQLQIRSELLRTKMLRKAITPTIRLGGYSNIPKAIPESKLPFDV